MHSPFLPALDHLIQARARPTLSNSSDAELAWSFAAALRFPPPRCDSGPSPGIPGPQFPSWAWLPRCA